MEMYRKAMRIEVVKYVYDSESDEMKTMHDYKVAIIGKETDAPAFQYDDNCVYCEEVGKVESGFIAMSAKAFRDNAVYAKNRYVGGVNESCGKSYTVSGDYFDTASKTLVRNVTKTVSADELRLFVKVTKKVESCDGWRGMSAMSFYRLGTWCDSEDEVKAFA